MYDVKHSITLLFNANKVYDRQVIEGIGRYLQTSRVSWDIYLEEDFLTRLDHIDEWSGDGIIADFDDPSIEAGLKGISLPIVGVGGSYSNARHYPDVPYVATDNAALMEAAYLHLKRKGLERFAYYGLPAGPQSKWASEREKALVKLCHQDGYDCSIFLGQATKLQNWQQLMASLTEWLQSLPTPIGVVAVTDARARHVLQACDLIGKEVPDTISIIGIDDDDIARNLSRISLSSVSQGAIEMGFQAAKLLHRKMETPKLRNRRILVPPSGVVERQSTDFKALRDTAVIQAMHFIRQRACSGIKVSQVLDFVGISRSNLETRFFNEMGHSIHSEIHNTKLTHACNMLQSTSLSTEQVSAQSGYPSLQYMYAVFKKHFNQTPAQYRNQQCSMAKS
jgi:LacI family transcriptional regulator